MVYGTLMQEELDRYVTRAPENLLEIQTNLESDMFTLYDKYLELVTEGTVFKMVVTVIIKLIKKFKVAIMGAIGTAIAFIIKKISEGSSSKSHSSGGSKKGEGDKIKYRTIEEGIRDHDLPKLREAIGTAAYFRDLKEFERLLKYVVDERGVKDLYEDLNSDERVKIDKSKDRDDLFTLAVFELKDNFSKERVDDLRAISKYYIQEEDKIKNERFIITDYYSLVKDIKINIEPITQIERLCKSFSDSFFEYKNKANGSEKSEAAKAFSRTRSEIINSFKNIGKIVSGGSGYFSNIKLDFPVDKSSEGEFLNISQFNGSLEEIKAKIKQFRYEAKKITTTHSERFSAEKAHNMQYPSNEMDSLMKNLKLVRQKIGEVTDRSINELEKINKDDSKLSSELNHYSKDFQLCLSALMTIINDVVIEVMYCATQAVKEKKRISNGVRSKS